MNIPVTDVVPTYVREDQKIIPVLMHLQPNAVQLVVTVKTALPAVLTTLVLMPELRNVVPAITVTILAIMVPNRYLAVQTMFQPGFLQPNAGPAVMNANIIPIVALLRQIVLMVAVLIIHVIYVCLANLLPQIHHLILVMGRLVMGRLVIRRLVIRRLVIRRLVIRRLPMILRRQIRQIIMNRIRQVIMNRIRQVIRTRIVILARMDKHLTTTTHPKIIRVMKFVVVVKQMKHLVIMKVGHSLAHLQQTVMQVKIIVIRIMVRVKDIREHILS